MTVVLGWRRSSHRQLGATRASNTFNRRVAVNNDVVSPGRGRYLHHLGGRFASSS
jgi:hypothetical protein